jgi:hypothetical protein
MMCGLLPPLFILGVHDEFPPAKLLLLVPWLFYQHFCAQEIPSSKNLGFPYILYIIIERGTKSAVFYCSEVFFGVTKNIYSDSYVVSSVKLN